MDDLISRQAAIDAINGLPKWIDTENGVCLDYADVIAVLSEHLPAAQPMRKKGEWIERSVFDEPQGKRIEQWQSAKCSVCGKYHTTPYLYYFDCFDWCPNCGARMKKRGEET